MISLLLWIIIEASKFSLFIELYRIISNYISHHNCHEARLKRLSCVIHNHRVVPRISNSFTIAEHYSGPRGMTTGMNLFSAPVISVQVAARERRRGSSKSRIEISPWGILAPRSCVKSLSSQWKDSETRRWICISRLPTFNKTIWKEKRWKHGKSTGQSRPQSFAASRCFTLIRLTRNDVMRAIMLFYIIARENSQVPNTLRRLFSVLSTE